MEVRLWLNTTGLGLAARFLAPWSSFTALISGGILTYDFASLKPLYPNWIGLFDALDSGFLIVIFLVSAILAAILS